MKVSFTFGYGLALLTLVLLSGCSTRPYFGTLTPQELYQRSVDYYLRGKYLDASEGLDFFTINYGGHALVDSAHYYLGLCHFHKKEYLLASDAFEQLTSRFPNSGLVPEAMFMIGECYWELSPDFSLDQEYTQEALDAYQVFIDYYPENRDRVEEAQSAIGKCREKMAHKVFANGIIYLKMKDFTAAQIYFQQTLDKYYDTPWAAEAALKIGETLAGAGKREEALAAYIVYLEKYPTHPGHDQAVRAVEFLRNPVEAKRDAASGND